MISQSAFADNQQTLSVPVPLPVPVPVPIESTLTPSEIVFNRGDYEQVLQIAAATPNAETLTLAARTLNTQAYLEPNNRKARRMADQARDFARNAFAVNPGHGEAYVQAAISDAIRGNRMSAMRAFLAGLASRSRSLLDKALSINPDDPWALSTSGAWHLEVARAGGARLYGANTQIGYMQMMRARHALPDNVAIAYETALRLIAADNRAWRTEALSALQTATTDGIILAAHEIELRRRSILLKEALAESKQAVRAFLKTYG